MKRHLILILCIVLGITQLVLGQSSNTSVQIPNPIRNYQLDNGSARDLANNKDGTINGLARAIKDRFGRDEKAIQLAATTSIATPSFFEGKDYKNGFTISFWTEIDEIIQKNNGNDPWEPGDVAFQAFFAHSGSVTAGNTLLGFSRRRDRALIDRYIPDGAIKKDWNVWFWDPINFTEKRGWYHIVIVYEKARTYLYVYDPYTKLESAMYNFLLQDLSSATNWGLGGYNRSISSLDDFKVFDVPLTREQVIELHGQESSPADGMYRISPLSTRDRSIGTVAQSRLTGSRTEIHNKYTLNTSTYQWVFEPVQSQENVYRIRMAYEEDMYLHLVNDQIADGTRVEISPMAKLGSETRSYEWLVIPNSNRENNYANCFIILNPYNTDLSLQPVNNNTDLGTALEVSLQKNTTDWSLSLVKTPAQIDEQPAFPFFSTPNEVEVKSAENTFFNLQNLDPLNSGTTVSRVGTSRAPLGTGYHNGFSLTPTKDGSYYLRGTGNSDNLYLHPLGSKEDVNTPVELLTLPNAVQERTTNRWEIQPISPFSYKYTIRSVLNNAVGIGTTLPITNGQVSKLKEIQPIPDKEDSWVLFERTLEFNEIYRFKPGVYRIKSARNPISFITTKEFSSANEARVEISLFDEQKASTYYWQIDYEYDEFERPVRDGTYVIKLAGTDNRYLHTVDNSLNTSTPLEVLAPNSVQVATFKWSIVPVGRSNPGEYYIKLAGDNSKNIYTEALIPTRGNQLELSTKSTDSSIGALSWVFEEKN